MVVYRIEAVTNDENKYRPCCHGCGCGGYEGACKYPCGVAHSGSDSGFDQFHPNVPKKICEYSLIVECPLCYFNPDGRPARNFEPLN